MIIWHSYCTCIWLSCNVLLIAIVADLLAETTSSGAIVINSFSSLLSFCYLGYSLFVTDDMLLLLCSFAFTLRWDVIL